MFSEWVNNQRSFWWKGTPMNLYDPAEFKQGPIHNIKVTEDHKLGTRNPETSPRPLWYLSRSPSGSPAPSRFGYWNGDFYDFSKHKNGTLEWKTKKPPEKKGAQIFFFKKRDLSNHIFLWFLQDIFTEILTSWMMGPLLLFPFTMSSWSKTFRWWSCHNKRWALMGQAG